MLSTIVKSLALICTLSAPAWACWSGHQVRVQGVRLLGSNMQLDPAQVRQYALWLPRIAALTPPGVSISTDDTPSQSAYAAPGWCTRKDETLTCQDLEWRETLPSLFDAVRVRSKASKAQVEAAMRLPPKAPLTIQVGYGDAAWAEARADALNARLRDEYLPLGFVTYGGAPASQQVAFVVKRKAQHAVVIGVFVERPRVEALADRLARKYGVKGFIRPI